MRTLVCACVAMLLPSAAWAQEEGQELRLLKPAARQGFYLAGGLRNGALTISDENLGGLGFMTGFGVAVRGGQMANDWIGFGLAINTGGGGNDVWGGGWGALSLELMLTPLPGEDFAIRGSVGVGGMGVARAKPEEETEKDPSGTAGALYTLGVSYDLFPWYEKDKYESGGFAFTGFLEGMLLPGDGLIAGGVMIGLEVTYWFGFNKNKLDIPPEAY